jgi:ABC-type Fe3+/spermidine/putrescine transport system ATPase subunit
MIRLQDISFSYDSKTPVLQQFNLTVKKSEIVVIKGKSGQGKSTILRLIAGLEQAQSGDVFIDGINVNAVPTNKRHIGYVFQNHALFPHLTIAKNIGFGIRHLPQHEEMVKEIAQKVDIASLLDRYPHEISGGQKQRVAIARSLVTKPKVLLLDEPFNGLDEELKGTIRTDIRTILQDFHITTIVVTHDIEDAIALGARVIELHETTQ